MITKQTIYQQLSDMGAPKTGIVIVHTSLRAIGKIEGGAGALLDALIDYFTGSGGVLCVPTHTWQNWESRKDIVLDLRSNQTCIGTFPDIVAADSRGIRTDNPTHSMRIFGDKEKIRELYDLESKVNKPTSPLGVYGKIVENGHVLLIGVGHNKNTCMHSVEDKINVPNRYAKNPAKMKVIDYNGQTIEREFYYMHAGDIFDVSAFYPKYEPAIRYHGGIIDGVIGNAKTQLCDCKVMEKVMRMVFEKSGGIELMSNDAPLKEEWYK